MLFIVLLTSWLGCADRPTGEVDPPEPPTAPAPPAPAVAPVIPPNPAAEPFSLSAAPPAHFPNLRASGAVHFPLHQIAGRYTLTDIKLPPAVAKVGDQFALDAEEVPNPRNAPRVLAVSRALLPFPVADDEQTFKPAGMSVFIDGEEVPFSRGPAPQAKRSSWRINGKHLVLSHPTIPEAGQLVVRYSGVRDAVTRHDPAASGLTPEAFVRYGLTIDQHTRHGLLLPAPSRGEWDLVVPEQAPRFEAFLAMEPAPLAKPRSDGAEAVLSVRVDGTLHEVDRREVPAKAEGFDRWTVDLTPWAGRTVTVVLSTEPKTNAAFDWVFLGSPAVWGAPTDDVRRVIVVGLDTTRYDRIGAHGYARPTTPELDVFASTAAVFDHTWTPAPRTRPSFRSATTGRRPLDAVGATNIAEVFQREGFATAGIVANVHLQPRFGFDIGFDSWRFDGRADAAGQVDQALAWLTDNQDRDTYLFLHFMDPHMIYSAPGEWREKFMEGPLAPDLPPRVTRAEVLAMMKRGALTDAHKKQLSDLHDSEMAYLSHELGRFFAAVDAMPGHTVVVVHSDHGEEFWDHGGFEHNHTLFDDVTRGVLWIRPGGGLPEGLRLTHPATLADIGPTLFDLAGVASPPPLDGRSLVPAMRRESEGVDRAIPIAHIQYSHERWGVVYRGHKYILHTASGQEELYDLVADPKELRDKAASVDLTPWRAQLGESHAVAAGLGWRVRFDLRAQPAPFSVTLPMKPKAAIILDPEAAVEQRANIEWGETPRRVVQDIGRLSLSADGTTMTIEPGTDPEGIAIVWFDAEHTPQAARLLVADAEASMERGKRGRTWRDGNRHVIIEPGMVLIPPPTEAMRMGLGPAAPAAGDDEHAMLCELGYIQCDD